MVSVFVVRLYGSELPARRYNFTCQGTVRYIYATVVCGSSSTHLSSSSYGFQISHQGTVTHFGMKQTLVQVPPLCQWDLESSVDCELAFLLRVVPPL